MLSSVAPAPISISSEWAPRQRTDKRSLAAVICNALHDATLHGRLVVAWTPPHLSPLHHFLKHLSIPQRIHRPPESLVLVGDELPCLDQAIKWLEDKFIAFVDIIENLPAKDEVSTVNPNFRLLTRTETLHRAVAHQTRQVKGERRMNGDEAADLPLFLKRSIISGNGASVNRRCSWRENFFVLDEILTATSRSPMLRQSPVSTSETRQSGGRSPRISTFLPNSEMTQSLVDRLL